MKNLLAVTFLFLSTLNISNEPGYEIGDYIEDFSLKNIDGNFVSLSNFNNAKGFIVVFTCNTCPYAVKYEERIIALDKKYASKGYPVIAIMPNNTEVKPGDSFENMQKRAKEKSYTFPYLIDSNQNVYPKFGATKTPHIYILKKDPKGLQVKYIGGIDDNYKDESQVTNKYVEKAVDELLANKKVSQTKTKAIGCSIKVK